jgi:NTP pyrophosphatase (non-canonical NTP hydrolase)
MYYLYHIPGKKIGVTRNINNRVTVAQGYKPGEYEVLDQSKDINYISNREIELQNVYGYKVDRTLYKNLFKSNMKINPTDQTSTFPVPLNKLKGHLMDNLGLTWSTPQGYDFEITPDTIKWIMSNATTSMFNNNRCYIYNKAFYEAFKDAIKTPKEKTLEDVFVQSNLTNYFPLIRDWAEDRGIYEHGNSHTQYVKLMEEAGELAKALLDDNIHEIEDAIGDMVVVLTNLAELNDLKIERCIETAYNQIKNRKGVMSNGTFVKESL